MPQINQDAANIPSVNLVEQGSDIATPGTGHVQLYVKSGAVYIRLDDGTVLAVGGVPTLTEDSLAVGGAGDLLTALTPGAEGAVPTRQADGTIEEVVPTPGGGGGETLIEAWTVAAGGEASHTFSDIPQTHKHLRLYCFARTERASTGDWINVRVNGDASDHHSGFMFGRNYNGTAGGGVQDDLEAQAVLAITTAASSPAGWLSTYVADFPLYRASGVPRRWLGVGVWPSNTGATATYHLMSYGETSESAAISSLTLTPRVGSEIAEGSYFALYGLD